MYGLRSAPKPNTRRALGVCVEKRPLPFHILSMCEVLSAYLPTSQVHDHLLTLDDVLCDVPLLMNTVVNLLKSPSGPLL